MKCHFQSNAAYAIPHICVSALRCLIGALIDLLTFRKAANIPFPFALLPRALQSASSYLQAQTE